MEVTRAITYRRSLSLPEPSQAGSLRSSWSWGSHRLLLLAGLLGPAWSSVASLLHPRWPWPQGLCSRQAEDPGSFLSPPESHLQQAAQTQGDGTRQEARCHRAS